MKNNYEITQEIVAVILEEVNGYTAEEAKMCSKQHNGEVEIRIRKILNKNFPQNNDDD